MVHPLDLFGMDCRGGSYQAPQTFHPPNRLILLIALASDLCEMTSKTALMEISKTCGCPWKYQKSWISIWAINARGGDS